MSALRVLFIGGSGIISSACCRLAVQRGPADVTALHGDVRDPASVREALGRREFDVVVNCVAFTLDHVEADLERFVGGSGSISSSVPPRRIRLRHPGCRSPNQPR